MTTQTTYAALRPLGEQQTLLETQAGELFEIDLPVSALEQLLQHTDDVNRIAALLRQHGASETAEVFFKGLEEVGVIADEQPAETHRLSHIESLTLCNLSDWSLDHLLPPDIQAKSTSLEQLPSALEDNGNTLCVVISETLDEATFAEIDSLCERCGIAWVSFHIEQGRGWLGPLVIPANTANVRDLLARRRCSGDQIEAAQLQAPQAVGQRALTNVSVTVLQWMLGLFFNEIEQALSTGHCRLFSSEVCADPLQLTTQSFAFLPLPTHNLPGALLTSATSAQEQLINSRSGIILAQHQVEHHPSIPDRLITVQSHCCDISQVYEWQNDAFVCGSAFDNFAAAQGASLGEAIERYCGNYIPSLQPKKASYRELMAVGEYALDPEAMVLHSKTMLETPGCPFVPFTRDLPVQWVKGQSITKNRDAWLPLSLVFANWITPQTQNEPVTHHLWTPGMAGGRNLEEALVGAIREVVERDITMAWWYNGVKLPSVALTPELKDLVSEVEANAHQKFSLIHLDNPFQIPVMVGIVEDTHEKLINIGFGCRPDPVEAARKAWSEALTLQEGSRDLLLPDSIQRQTALEWDILHVPYKAWREDRSYLDAFDQQFRDVTDLMVQPQVLLDPRAYERVKPLLDTPATRTFADLPQLPDNRFATYRERVEREGFEIFYADITSPDVALTGMRTVRVIIPGLIPNMPAAFPAVGGQRVFQLPLQMGWLQTPRDEASLNFFPMPHA
jgi:ribosomal protein S12 methylthiotransferase accessory factor